MRRSVIAVVEAITLDNPKVAIAAGGEPGAREALARSRLADAGAAAS